MCIAGDTENAQASVHQRARKGGKLQLDVAGRDREALSHGQSDSVESEVGHMGRQLWAAQLRQGLVKTDQVSGVGVPTRGLTRQPGSRVRAGVPRPS